MKLSANFSLDELIFSDYATRNNIKNIPSPQVIENLKKLSETLELVRSFLGNLPITINSGYRNTELNRALKGAATSAHLSGFAADFTCRKYGTPLQIVKALKSSGIKYDQLIEEGTWVHISIDPRMRQQTLSAVFGNKTTYKEF